MEAGARNRATVELWRPNRQKAECKRTKSIVTLLLLASAGLGAIVAIGGWTRLEGGGAIALAYVALYVLFAFLVSRWNRGVLPVASALAIILAIFAAVSTPAWFERTKEGFESPALPEDFLGLITLVLVPVQVLLIAAAMRGFNQQWHVEEERPARGA